MNGPRSQNLGMTENITGRLASYMASVDERPLPQDVHLAAKHRILDTVAAIVSGADMTPGQFAINYVRALAGAPQASVMASSVVTTAADAALANAMCAHADETDDFDPETKAHPGSSSVPAALAVGEKNGSSGESVIRSVALGYDLGCRLLLALGAGQVRASHRSAEGTSSTFCALGASAPLAKLDERGMRHAISYAAQQVSGIWSWVKDEDHIEKAFDFAGMGARNGVTAVTMVESGMTGVYDVLDGTHNLFIALSSRPDPEAMVDRLGSRFFIAESSIKTFSVGYPNQSALDAALTLRRQHGFDASHVKAIRVKLPTDAIGIVGASAMPDVSCQHLVSLALLKGAVSFEDSHDAGVDEERRCARRARAAHPHRRRGADGPRRTARCHRRDRPAGWAQLRAPHALCSRHQGAPAGHPCGQPQGARPDGTGTWRCQDRRVNRGTEPP